MAINSKAGYQRLIAASTLCLGASVCAPVFAQDILHDWDLSSEVTLRGGFENVNGENSHFVIAAPQFSLQRQNDDLSISLSGNAELDQVGGDQFSARSLGTQATVGLRLNQHAAAELGISYGITQPRSSDPDLPTDVKVAGHEQQFGLVAQYSHQFSKTAMQLRGSVGRSQTANSLLNDNSYQSNADQNAWTYGIGGRISRELTPTIQAFVDAQLSRSRFDATSTTLGASRNSWTYEAEIGAEVSFDQRLQGTASLGYLRQSFDDTSLDALQTFTYGANLDWQTSDTSQVVLAVDTNISPSPSSGEAMRIVDTGRLTFNQQINSSLQGSVFGELQREHYQTSTDEIKTTRAGLGLQYQANKQLSAFANYSFSLREAPTDVRRTHLIEAGLRFNRQ
ncbi:outer membrane beta-barrel protein [Maritalea porphyrae]|uniref:Outer membrane beta-barrel protein n=1 Tax=Maritalea porphyrae TaxID=880732 RepID=A0ABQ5UPV3_9HYPH|nr:outer membrane beta-barrel protein [Maritalea porphyrae]GLQ16340.1 hypothetical protein GCM10007879_05890 [Maritalea porphyrae]